MSSPPSPDRAGTGLGKIVTHGAPEENIAPEETAAPGETAAPEGNAAPEGRGKAETPAPQDSPKRQFHSLTSLRGIAAIMVVVFHFSGAFLPDLHLSRRSDIVPKSYLWVDLFFLLSGFIMMHVYGETFRTPLRKGEFGRFVLARVARIYPVHVFMLLAFLVLELVKLALWHFEVVNFHNPPFSARATKDLYSFVMNLLMLQSTGVMSHLTWNGPAWSVGAEWYAYLAFPILALAAYRLSWPWRVAIVVVSIAGLVMLSSDGNMDVTYDYGLVRCLLEFTSGIIVYLVYESGFMRSWLRSDASAVAVIAVLLALMHFGAPDPVFPPVFAVLVLALARDEGWVSRALSRPTLLFLGAISYSVYMLHVFVLEAIDVTWRAVEGERFGVGLGTTNSLLALLILLALVITLSAGLHQWVEVPARAAVKRSGSSLLPEALTRKSRR